jgi:hypothetical protein
MRLLIDSKADLKLQTWNGDTGLLLAAGMGRFDCLTLMIDGKADVDEHNKSDMNGLHLACQDGYVENVRLLIDSNADVQLQEEEGQTGLILAARNGQPECLKLMIDAKANINHQPQDGYSSALCGAILQRSIECFYVLLDHPSDAPASDHVKSSALIQALDSDGFSALAQTAAFVLLACAEVVKEAIYARDPSDRIQSAMSRYCNVQSFIDEWHGVAVAALSNDVRVDTRVGRGDYGLYHEPLERVLEYLGLSMTVNQVVNTNVDGKSTRRALIPNQARGADQWHGLFKRTHCASCSVCPGRKMKKCPCETVWYCSTDCQRTHWKKEHRPDHKRILEEQQEERKKKEGKTQKKDAK